MRLSELNLLTELYLSNLNSSNMARQLGQILDQQGFNVSKEPALLHDRQLLRAGIAYLFTVTLNGMQGRGLQWQIYYDSSKQRPCLMARGADGKTWSYSVSGGTSRFVKGFISDVRSRLKFYKKRDEVANWRPQAETATGNNDETVAYP